MTGAADDVAVHVQVAADHTDLPDAASFTRWVRAAIAGAGMTVTEAAVTVRLVDEDESALLNSGYRDKAGPTNVLAFVTPASPVPLPAGEERELGDLAICIAVAAREAAEQGKTLAAHLTHLTVHGTLHLLGYDHLNDADADVMEGLERSVLAELGLPDPYAGETAQG